MTRAEVLEAIEGFVGYSPVTLIVQYEKSWEAWNVWKMLDWSFEEFRRHVLSRAGEIKWILPLEIAGGIW